MATVSDLALRDAYEAHADRLDDLTLLSTIEDESIADHLTKRHAEGEMYTAIGDVLIAVNPYNKLSKAEISTYDPKVAWHFFKTEKLGLVPHIFHVAADAYHHLREKREDSCILVTGESGAGKTESAKHIMQFITVVSPESASKRFGGNSEVRRVEQVKSQLLNSSPLLEALGNAKTSRNDNSSRFGKYLELQFDYAGGVVGGKVTSYLLEKSRVIGHAENERGFHMFSQFCMGCYRPDLTLPNAYVAPARKAEEFKYMMNTTKTVDGVDDETTGFEVEEAMLSVGMVNDDRGAIGRILSGILCLGNIEFEHMEDATTGGSQVTKSTETWLKAAAESFGVQPNKLAVALTTHALIVNNQTNLKHLGHDESASNTDTLAKETYKRLFDWVIQQVNKGTDVTGMIGSNSMSATNKSREFLCLGVLDIYGFEILGTNGFEQLCINFVNEKLQQLAIALTLKGEQEEYASEGIGWVDIAYVDNQPVVSMIENQRGGLLSLLDEACTFRNASASTFASSMARAYNLDKPPTKDSLVTAPKNKRGQESFCVRHYAGEVLYNYEGFVEKNEDSLYHDLVDCLSESSCVQLASMFIKQSEEEEGKAKKRPPSVSLQFKRQVNSLMSTLSQCKPHYVRCVKPNSTKSPLTAEKELMIHQVQYLGLTETVKVRRAGFCLRLPFVRFLRRYSLVCGHKDVWPLSSSIPSSELCRLILCSGQPAKLGNLTPFKLEEGTDFVIGKTKVFIKAPKTMFQLEAQRAQVLPYLATDINKQVRGKVARKRFAQAIRQITLIEAKARRLNDMRAYKRTRLTLLSLATCIRKFIAKAKVAKLRVQFKNRPPRTYALVIQKRFRGNKERLLLDEAIREQCRMCAYRAKYSKAIRDIQCALRCAMARTKLKRHLAARKIENFARCVQARMKLKSAREKDFKDAMEMLTSTGYAAKKHPSSKGDKKEKLRQVQNPLTSGGGGAAAAAADGGKGKKQKLPAGVKQKEIFIEKLDGGHELHWSSDSYFRKRSKVALKNIVKGLVSLDAQHAFAKTGYESDLKQYLCLVHREGKSNVLKNCALEFNSEWHRDRFLRTVRRVAREEGLKIA